MAEKRRPIMHLCGTPAANCSASPTQVNASMGGRKRAHISSQDAFNCHKNYLLSLGYTQLDSRAFAAPNDGPVRVLTKATRFGAPLRNGKEGTRNMSSVRTKGGGSRGGNIVSS